MRLIRKILIRKEKIIENPNSNRIVKKHMVVVDYDSCELVIMSMLEEEEIIGYYQ